MSSVSPMVASSPSEAHLHLAGAPHTEARLDDAIRQLPSIRAAVSEIERQVAVIKGRERSGPTG